MRERDKNQQTNKNSIPIQRYAWHNSKGLGKFKNTKQSLTHTDTAEEEQEQRHMFWWSESHHHLDAYAKHVRRPTMCETVCIGEETKGKHQKYHKTNTYQQGKKETQNYSKQQIPQTANVYTMYDKQ